jgi:hypothetical protein
MRIQGEPSPFRSGSPRTDSLGFIGTALGKRAREEAKKAQGALHAIEEAMSLNEAKKWLKDSYPHMAAYLTVRPHDATYIRNPNQRFANSEKDIVVG